MATPLDFRSLFSGVGVNCFLNLFTRLFFLCHHKRVSSAGQAVLFSYYKVYVYMVKHSYSCFFYVFLTVHHSIDVFQVPT